MLRCIQCGSEDEFLVDELCRHTIRIRCAGDWEYTFVEEEEFIEVEAWADATCCTCQAVMDSEDAKAEYDEAHGEDVHPIPYRLVDASES
jgi:hypothetical protein